MCLTLSWPQGRTSFPVCNTRLHDGYLHSNLGTYHVCASPSKGPIRQALTESAQSLFPQSQIHASARQDIRSAPISEGEKTVAKSMCEALHAHGGHIMHMTSIIQVCVHAKRLQEWELSGQETQSLKQHSDYVILVQLLTLDRAHTPQKNTVFVLFWPIEFHPLTSPVPSLLKIVFESDGSLSAVDFSEPQ